MATKAIKDDTDDLFPIIFDTGSSTSMTFCLDDFEHPPMRGSFGSVQTADGRLQVSGLGLVRWEVVCTDGTSKRIQVPAHYVESGHKIRLFSPQDYARYHDLPLDGDAFGVHYTGCWMRFPDSNSVLVAHTDGSNQVPMILATNGGSPTCKADCCANLSCDTYLHMAQNVLSPHNANLSGSQKELLLDHFRLGHHNMQSLQRLYRSNEDEPGTKPCLMSRAKHLNVDISLCRACQYAKARRRPTRAKHTNDIPDRMHTLSTDHLEPGDVCSVDQYESSVRGRLPNTKGKEMESSKYCGGTLFIDRASGRIFVYHQSSLSSTDTIISKKRMELEARSCGVETIKFHTDNGIFKSKQFEDEINSNEQFIYNSGVGAHHQNGRAERAIQTVQNMARAMLLHAAIHWPDEYDPELWPFAMQHAAYIYNHHLPQKDLGWLSPMEVYCKTVINCTYLRRMRVWGCPVYVLSPKLKDGRKIPKWEPKARLGQNLGISDNHSSTINLIRNITTQRISPQFHVVYDESFTTVEQGPIDNIDDLWHDMFTTSRENLIEEENLREDQIPELHPDWLPADEENEQHPPQQRRSQRHHNQQNNTPPHPITVVNEIPEINPEIILEVPPHHPDPLLEPIPVDIPPVEIPPPEFIIEEAPREPAVTFDIPENPPERIGPRRNPRRAVRNQPIRGRAHPSISTLFPLFARKTHTTPTSPHVTMLNLLDWSTANEDPMDSAFSYLLEATTHPLTREIYDERPLAFSAKVGSTDNPTLQQILRMPDGPERDAWFQAMYDELDELMAKKTFKLVPRKKAVSRGKAIIPVMWVFRKKRKPDGTVTKFKARLVVRDDRQDLSNEEGGEDTYAPVVDWGTVRMALNCTVQYKLASRSIDFKNAFVQSFLPEPIIFIEVPEGGYRENYPDKILEVERSLYGDRRAPRLWYNHLRSYLLSEGFTPSDIDPCLFLLQNLAIIVYVDDAIILSRDDATIGKFLDKLNTDQFEFTIDGDFASYLGVTINFNRDGSIKLTQEHLTNQIIQLLGLETGSPKPTPCVSIIGKSLDSPPASGSFNYRSALGMLQYLCNNTRPDCTFAISQCARFSNNPREPHEMAVKRIGRYLLGTKDAGILFRPSSDPTLDMYVDADFAGLWNFETAQDPDSVHSRSGYIIMLGESPVAWGSKLQTEISSSTMEAEYIALSNSMKKLIPLRVTYTI